jgi:hypothetical protein
VQLPDLINKRLVQASMKPRDIAVANTLDQLFLAAYANRFDAAI